MANGRPNKESGYCDYQYVDKTFCREKINGIFINKKQETEQNNNWNDKNKNNYCLYHSHNDEKGDYFYNHINDKININNKNVKDGISLLKKLELSESERIKRENEIRNNSCIDFEGYYFPGNTDFSTYNFLASLICVNAIFKGEVQFHRTKFFGLANFSLAEFTEKTLFSWAVFREYAQFNGTTFLNDFHSFSIEFHNIASFSGANFNGKADFMLAKFFDRANLNEIKFNSEVIFSGARFNNDTTFINTLFLNNVDFSLSTFLKALDFTDSAFFFGKVLFNNSKFSNDEAFFNNTIFNCKVLFHRQVLKGVRFTGCYLGSASFYGSDVRDAVFINSSWNRSFLEKQIEKLNKDERIEKSISVLDINKKPPRTKRRAILFDEKSYRFCEKTNNDSGKNESESSNPELDPLYLEHLYCQFKLAMDRNKMYGLANDFYYGEKLMETKRLREEHSYLKWAFLWLYRLLAGFGNRPLWAISWLIIILLASSFLLIRLNGLNVENKKDAFERCSFENNVTKSAAIDKPNLKTPTTLTKAGKSNESTLLNHNINNIISSNRQTPSTQPANTSKQDNTKKEAGYSLKDSYWSNIFYVSLWNLTASPGRKSSDYKENGWIASLAVFLIQYIFRPLMVALIIISVRRKVYRG